MELKGIAVCRIGRRGRVRSRTGWLSYLEFVESRPRLNTLRAVASDLGIVLSFVDKDPATVKTDDVLRFVADQRAPRFDGSSRISGV